MWDVFSIKNKKTGQKVFSVGKLINTDKVVCLGNIEFHQGCRNIESLSDARSFAINLNSIESQQDKPP